MTFSILLAAAVSTLPQANDDIPVELHVRSVWEAVAVVPPPDGAPARVSAAATLRTRVAVDPGTDEPFATPAEARSYDAAHLRRILRLEKTEFLVGEPILVELRVELAGPGTHREAIGGNYRARGRDDNFLVLMRHEDGTWVDDPYGPIVGSMGGLGIAVDVSRDAPFSHWVAAQRRCAIERPGVYDVYCLHTPNDWELVGADTAKRASLPTELRDEFDVGPDNVLIERATGERTDRRVSPSWRHEEDNGSPITTAIPRDVRDRAAPWPVDDCTTFTHWRIRIRAGTASERATMVVAWSELARSGRGPVMQSTRADAASYAIAFARGEDFLPLLAQRLEEGGDETLVLHTGLATNPAPPAFDLLISRGTDALPAMYFLDRTHIARAIPHLIEWLTSDEPEVRSRAESYLVRWTGVSFDHTWQGYSIDRPTPEEAVSIQQSWREWWDENEESFRPR